MSMKYKIGDIVLVKSLKELKELSSCSTDGAIIVDKVPFSPYMRRSCDTFCTIKMGDFLEGELYFIKGGHYFSYSPLMFVDIVKRRIL